MSIGAGGLIDNTGRMSGQALSPREQFGRRNPDLNLTDGPAQDNRPSPAYYQAAGKTGRQARSASEAESGHHLAGARLLVDCDAGFLTRQPVPVTISQPTCSASASICSRISETCNSKTSIRCSRVGGCSGQKVKSNWFTSALMPCDIFATSLVRHWPAGIAPTGSTAHANCSKRWTPKSEASFHPFFRGSVFPEGSGTRVNGEVIVSIWES
jgi:hypothetical protein